MESSRSERETTGGPDPILPLVRSSIWALFILAALNGFYLYLFPGQAETDYAWPILPAATAAFMGCGYLAGLMAAYLGIFHARFWRSVHALVPAFIALSLIMLAATLIHSDRFRWDYPPTWIWTAVYAGIPIAATLLYRMQSRVATDTPPRNQQLAPLRGLLLVAGTVLTVLGLFLFVAPDGFIADWPWQLTDLTSRILAGWYVLSGGMLLVVGVGLARSHELVVPLATVGTWTALIVLLPLFYDEIDTGDGAFWAWLSLHVAVLAICAYGLSRAISAVRRSGEAPF